MSTDLKQKLGESDVVLSFGLGRPGQQKIGKVASARKAFSLHGAVREDTPLGPEWTIREPVNEALTVEWSFRFNGDVGLWCSVTVENCWPEAQHEWYDLFVEAIRPGGVHGVLGNMPLIHPKWTRPSFVIWLGERGFDTIQDFDRALWERTGVIPRYVDALDLDFYRARYFGAERGLWTDAQKSPLHLQTGLYPLYMGKTGNDNEIGLLPEWVAAALITKDPAFLRLVVEQDRLTGSFPIHVRSRDTGQPMTIEESPNFVAVQPSMPDGVEKRDFDAAHHPFVGGIAWKLTGARWHREEALFAANWLLLNKNASDRGHSIGDIMNHEQRRGTAWKWRTIAWCARHLVGADNLKRVMERNLDLLDASLDNGFGGIRVEGTQDPWFCEPKCKGFNPSYNESYLLTVLGESLRMGYPVENPIRSLIRWPVARHMQWPVGEASPYLAVVMGPDGRKLSIMDSHRLTYINRNGKPFSWPGTRSYGAHDRAALLVGRELGVPDGDVAFSRADAQIGSPSFTRDVLWGLRSR